VKTVSGVAASQPNAFRARSSLRTGFVCLITSMLVAGIGVTLNKGFGVNDLSAFLFWSLPFAALVACLGLVNIYRRVRLLTGYLIAVIAGTLLGIVWTFIVGALLGPSFGAFGFPVWSCWVAGGASAMVTSVGTFKEVRQFFSELILVGSICLFAVVGAEPFSIWLSADQKLEVTMIKWLPGPSELTMQRATDPPNYYGPLTKDLIQLKEIGLTGKLNFSSGGHYGEGNKSSRAIIVMQRQIKQAVDLPQPDGVTIIYIQDENNHWKRYPSDAPVLNRNIRLEVPANKPTLTDYWVELANGARQGAQAFYWD